MPHQELVHSESVWGKVVSMQAAVWLTQDGQATDLFWPKLVGTENVCAPHYQYKVKRNRQLHTDSSIGIQPPPAPSQSH